LFDSIARVKCLPEKFDALLESVAKHEEDLAAAASAAAAAAAAPSAATGATE